MEPTMEPIMTRAEAARHIEAARLRTGRTWAGIAEDLGHPWSGRPRPCWASTT